MKINKNGLFIPGPSQFIKTLLAFPQEEGEPK